MPRSKKPREKSNGYRPPAAVGDLAALDAARETFVLENTVARHTRLTLEGRWRLWERHCADLKVDPLDAPWAVWQELAGLRRDDGRRYANSQLLKGILNAVEHYYREHKVASAPAPRHPDHVLDWRAVCGEWASLATEARARTSAVGEESEVELRNALPIMREDILAMLAVPVDAPHWPRDARRPSFVQERAQLLVAFDTQAPAWRLELVSLDDIEAREDGSVAFGAFTLPCDHRERVLGVPWDCSACAVLAAVAARPEDGPQTSFVLGFSPAAALKGARSRFRSRLVRVRSRWRGLEAAAPGQEASRLAALVPKPGLSARELAGLRRGLVVAEAGPKGMAWLVGRPWVGVAWAAGFRMRSDLAGLPRSAAQSLVTGEPGVLLKLGATKTDQGGSVPVKRPFTFTGQPTITQALVEYLTVRDAAVGDNADGPLFISSSGGLWPAKFIAKPGHVCSAFLEGLTRAAGLDKRFVPKSTRMGFVAQAEADGWDLERVQTGARHVRLETTLTHYREAAPKKAARKLIYAASASSS